MSLLRDLTKALIKADSAEANCYPDYEELARVAIKVVRKHLKKELK